MTMTGRRLRSALPETQFESAYSLTRFEYLGDHRIYGMPVLPLTAGLMALRDAARQHFATDGVVLANLQYREALILPEAGECIVQSILTPVDDATAEFRLTSTEADAVDGWRTHMAGMARNEAWEEGNGSVSTLDQVKLRCRNPVPAELYYKALHGTGLQYGPSFRAIQELWRGNDEALTRVRLPPHVAVDGVEALHPALLDACLHVYPALIEDYGNFEQAPQALRHTYLPIAIERFRSNGPGGREVWAHAVRRSAQDDPQTVTIDIAVYREDGSRAATLEGLSLRQLSAQALAPGAAQGRPDWLYLLQWVEQPQLKGPPAERTPDGPSAWLILADQGGVGAALADKLADRGGICRLVSIGDVVGHDSMCSWSPDDLVKPFAALLAGSTERSVPLRGVIDLWPLDVTTGLMTARELRDSQKIVTGGALALFRAMAEARVHPGERGHVHRRGRIEDRQVEPLLVHRPHL